MDKKPYSDIAKKALNMATNKNSLHEGFGYPKDCTERMHPKIEEMIMNRKTSIGNHPALPSGGVRAFDQKLLLDRFLEVVDVYKEAFDLSENSTSIDTMQMEASQLLLDCMDAERPNRKLLVELATELIRKEYNLSEDSVKINASLVDSLTTEKELTREFSDEEFSMEFKKHSDIENAEKEIMKRRFINTMIQGAANKCNHMYHMQNRELSKINPTLINKYKKLMALNDLMYFKMLKPNAEKPGGVVSVKHDDGIPTINAEAITFPVLIHELVKGVMELISLHGFTEDEKLNEFVVSQADFLAAEPWDLRIGPAIWGKFMDSIPPKDNDMKHHIFYELIKKPTDSFNASMKEIMAGTSEGKKMVEGIVRKVRSTEDRERIEEIKENRRNEVKEKAKKDLTRLLDNDLNDLFPGLGD